MKSVFGDIKQIKEIKNYRIEQETKEKSNTYDVTIYFGGTYYATIDAETEEEAIEEAEEEFSLIDADDWDIEHTTARIIK